MPAKEAGSYDLKALPRQARSKVEKPIKLLNLRGCGISGNARGHAVRQRDAMSTTSDPTILSASAAAAAIREGRITSRALVDRCLERISEREPSVLAWAHLDRAYALKQADAADAAIAAGAALGVLHGVPVGIKDVIDTADFPTENGTPAFAGRRPETDAAVVAALRAAGA